MQCRLEVPQENFTPLLDLFQKESQVEVNKALLETFARYVFLCLYVYLSLLLQLYPQLECLYV